MLPRLLAQALGKLGHQVAHSDVFDTLRVTVSDVDAIKTRAINAQINLRYFEDGSVGVSLDETVTAKDLADLVEVFGGANGQAVVKTLANELETGYFGSMPRK